MGEKDLKIKTKKFAHESVKLALELPENILGGYLKKQLIRSSTSVAANYRVASISQTKVSFISKLSVVVVESDESEFWLEFIRDEGLIQRKKAEKNNAR